MRELIAMIADINVIRSLTAVILPFPSKYSPNQKVCTNIPTVANLNNPYCKANQNDCLLYEAAAL